MISRAPRGSLLPFIETVWIGGGEGAPAAARERLIPTGSMHLVVRLCDEPVRLYDALDAPRSRDLGLAVIGGPRSRYHVKDVARPARAIGAVLRPGAALPLLGAPAEAFAEQHAALVDVWGRGAAELRDQLLEAGAGACGAARDALQLARFEELLAARLPRVRGLHPAVALALERLPALAAGEDGGIGALVRETGYSHRRFVTVFRETVGLSPKRWSRVRRVHGLLARAARDPRAPWAALAVAAGYSDQAHLTRELAEIAGVTPGEYRRLAPGHALHVPVQNPARRAGARRGKVGS